MTEIITYTRRGIFVSFIWLVSTGLEAGMLWECKIDGKILSRPELIDNEWHMRFVGTKFEPQESDFCADWIDMEASISLTQKYFSKLGNPSLGDSVTLKEYKEENDYGQGLMQWRYFDLGYRD